MTYLVVAMRPGVCHRHECSSVASAAVASRIYRKWGWAVVVLPRVGS